MEAPAERISMSKSNYQLYPVVRFNAAFHKGCRFWSKCRGLSLLQSMSVTMIQIQHDLYGTAACKQVVRISHGNSLEQDRVSVTPIAARPTLQSSWRLNSDDQLLGFQQFSLWYDLDNATHERSDSQLQAVSCRFHHPPDAQGCQDHLECQGIAGVHDFCLDLTTVALFDMC